MCNCIVELCILIKGLCLLYKYFDVVFERKGKVLEKNIISIVYYMKKFVFM